MSYAPRRYTLGASRGSALGHTLLSFHLSRRSRREAARAFLHLHYGAALGDPVANMALGFRKLTGIGMDSISIALCLSLPTNFFH